VLQNACKALLEKSPRNAQVVLRTYGLKPFEKASAEELCEELGITRNNLYQVRHTACRQLLRILEDEVRETVSDEQEFEEEWKMVRGRLMEGASFLWELE